MTVRMGENGAEDGETPAGETLPSAPVLVFPDTNVLLHGKVLEELPFDAIVGAAGPLDVVLTATVLRELDAQKTKNPNSALRERATKRARSVWRRAKDRDVVLRPGVTLAFYSNAAVECLTRLDLDGSLGDDRILAEVLTAKSEASNRRVVLLSRDTGMLIKAKNLGLEAVELEGEHVLPVPDEQQAKLRKLQQENEKLRSRVPRLSVTFEGGEDYLALRVERPRRLSEGEVQQHSEEAGRATPGMQVAGPTEIERMIGTRLSGVTDFLGQPSEAGIREFNEKRERWLRELADYYETEWLEEEIREARTIVFSLALVNDGTCAATDVRVALQFGKDVSLEEMSRAFVRRRPAAPPPPRGLLDVAGLPAMPAHLDGLFGGRAETPNVRGPWVGETEAGPTCEWHVRKIRHGESHVLPAIALMLTALEDRNLRVDVRVAAEELPGAVEASMGIKVEYRDGAE